MTAVESKEEISDTDSGIILHSGEEAAVIFNYKWQSINKNVAEMLTSGWMADLFFFLCRSRQSHVSNQRPDHSHQSPEAEAPVSGGASGALSAGAEEALHQRGSQWIWIFTQHSRK